MSVIAIFRQLASFATGESVSGPTFVQPSRSRQRRSANFPYHPLHFQSCLHTWTSVCICFGVGMRL
jgi:hypothetical protein